MILATLNFTLLFFIFLSIALYFTIYYKRSLIGKKIGTNDIPDNIRKIHKNITPRTAGYSLALLLFSVLLFNLFFKFIDNDYNYIILLALIAFFIGLYDDKYNLSPSKKIFFLLILSLIATLSSEDLIISIIYIETFNTIFYLKEFSIPFTIICIILFANSMNLVDGINGLAVSLFLNFFFYIILFYQNENINFLLSITLVNLILIFFHNYKGKHFLGDAGTLMIAVFLSLIIIKANNVSIANTSQKLSAEQILILFLIPGIDMLRLFLLRILIKKNPFLPDRSHFHHYLLNKINLKETIIFYLLLINIPFIISFLEIFYPVYIISFTIIIFIVLIKIFKTKQY